MTKESIKEEMAICNSILGKFKEEMQECKQDYDVLKSWYDKEANNPNFKKAYLKVKERYDDITLSVKLVRNRLSELEEALANN